MSERRLFTSSAVLRGHPDKLCDRISDALVDAHLALDPEAHIRAESAAAGQVVFVALEADVRGQVDVTGVVRNTLAETRYPASDLDPQRCTILLQSSGRSGAGWSRPAQAEPDALPSGEQTTVFGYACSETPERMPLPIRQAHAIAGSLDRLVLEGELPGLGPDGNVQVTIEYEGDRPSRVDALVIQVQYAGRAAALEAAVQDLVLARVFRDAAVGPDRATRLRLNPEGPLLAGGPVRSAGHTGRKQSSDTYGAAARQGDGALSGKDPSRLDRSAAYAARHVAINVVAAGLATECELMLSYAIGQAEPTTVFARTFGRGRLSNEQLSALIRGVFDLRPGAIARRFRMWTLPREHRGTFYQRLAVGGHVGRTDFDLPWEALDAVDALRKAAPADAGSRSSTLASGADVG